MGEPRARGGEVRELGAMEGAVMVVARAAAARVAEA